MADVAHTMLALRLETRHTSLQVAPTPRVMPRYSERSHAIICDLRVLGCQLAVGRSFWSRWCESLATRLG